MLFPRYAYGSAHCVHSEPHLRTVQATEGAVLRWARLGLLTVGAYMGAGTGGRRVISSCQRWGAVLGGVAIVLLCHRPYALGVGCNETREFRVCSFRCQGFFGPGFTGFGMRARGVSPHVSDNYMWARVGLVYWSCALGLRHLIAWMSDWLCRGIFFLIRFLRGAWMEKTVLV
jgi:hypothetical protein